MNQRILVCLVQTHMVTVGVHGGEGYLNTHPPCELHSVMGEAGSTWQGGLSGCRVFCLFLGVWLPSLPCSGVAWSRLSSALFIVYLPNEGGGTLRRVIDSSVLCIPPPSTTPGTRTLASWLRCALKDKEGRIKRFFFTYLSVFLWEVFSLNPPLVGRPCRQRERERDCGLADMDTHTFLCHNYLKDDDSSAFLLLHLTQFLSSILNSPLVLNVQVRTYLAVIIKYLSTRPQSLRRVNLLPGGKKKEREEPNIGTVFISLCGRLQRDERGQ